MSTTDSPSTVIEHVVLFKVKDNTDPSKVNAIFTGFNGLISLDQVLHLTTGPLVRIRSPLSNFTHMFHSRYYSKEDLSAYSTHPSHLALVGETFSICDDIMVVDWVAADFQGLVVPPAGSAMRVTFLKLKEKVSEEGKNEVLRVIKGIKESIGDMDQITCGESEGVFDCFAGSFPWIEGNGGRRFQGGADAFAQRKGWGLFGGRDCG
ncbi:hypothetical protein HS088_TW23G00835 [Tripterygium wilfordii]|uniref:Stress-response A/B barrel domain-containing protein n=1 Tax=Tripterygium wilfordii TaxID=458696 RepID=A0A7J7BW57_TRIWF|nr:hypothetical protein HS088_TW23G00835 [Tripterygium wilfordii]